MTAPTSTERFVLLDGLRGMAALMVTALHATQALPWFYGNSNHAQLSVDFFFALSGFVLSYSYATRLSQGMTFPSFMQRRWIRLTPMVALGMLIATFGYAVKMARLGNGDQLVWLLGGSFLNANYLPSPWLLDLDHGSAYLANPPIWSLSAEMLASLAFATCLYCTSRKTLVILTAVFSLVLMVCALHFNAVDHGWELNKFQIGLVRVAFSFTVGVLIHRYWAARASMASEASRSSGSRVNTHALMLMGVFVALSYFPVPSYLNGGYEFICVAIFFPVLIYAASRLAIEGWLARFCLLLGDLSFPLYTLHYGVLRFFQPIRSHAWFEDRPIVTMCVEVVASACIAWLAFIWIDRPVRSWLSRRLGDRPRASDSGALRA